MSPRIKPKNIFLINYNMPSKSESHLSINLNDDKLIVGSSKNEILNTEIKEEVNDCNQDKGSVEDEEEDDEDVENECGSDEAPYPMDLPLEVITTIEPFNYAYPYLKNMSNGVLTHRNIFTEQEREVLKKIVDKYREIVDTRSRSREIYLEKQNVWQQIVEEYNSTENILVRTEKELKKCWDNMKYRARQAEKEQQKVDSMVQSNKFPDPHQIACNAVQAALEKMMTLGNANHELASENGSRVPEYLSGNHMNGSETWNSASLNSNDLKGESDKEGAGDDDYPFDDEQPVLKKARQESPKLSSILLDAKKSPYLKSENSSQQKGQYSIPNCTKVTHVKKKKSSKKNSNPVSILPKGLNSCVSIVNIPNPNNNNAHGSMVYDTNSEDHGANGVNEMHPPGAINLGGGITISPQKISNGLPYSSENASHAKQMPHLKKMPYKNSKKNISDSVDDRSLPSLSYGTYLQNDQISDLNGDRGILEERLLLQRLEFNSQEHALRMKVMEKQLQAYTNESQFWALKTKILKRTEGEHSTPKLVNGDI